MYIATWPNSYCHVCRIKHTAKWLRSPRSRIPSVLYVKVFSTILSNLWNLSTFFKKLFEFTVFSAIFAESLNRNNYNIIQKICFTACTKKDYLTSAHFTFLCTNLGLGVAVRHWG